MILTKIQSSHSTDQLEPTPELQDIIDDAWSSARLGIHLKRNLQIKLTDANSFRFTGIPCDAIAGRLFVYIPHYLNVSETNKIRLNHVIEPLFASYCFDIGDPAKWNTPEGRLLLKTFFLSPSEKKFLILHAIYSASSDANLRKLFHFFLFVYAYFGFWNLARFNRYSLQGLVITVFTFAFLAWILLTFNSMAVSDATYHGLAMTVTHNKYDWRGIKNLVSPDDVDKEMLYAALKFFETLAKRERLVFDLCDFKASGLWGMQQTPEGYVFKTFSNPGIQLKDVLDRLNTLKKIVETAETNKAVSVS